MKCQKLVFIILALMVSGCATISDRQCVSKSCTRPLSGPQQLVIWWSPGMRAGSMETTTHTLKE